MEASILFLQCESDFFSPHLIKSLFNSIAIRMNRILNIFYTAFYGMSLSMSPDHVGTTLPPMTTLLLFGTATLALKSFLFLFFHSVDFLLHAVPSAWCTCITLFNLSLANFLSSTFLQKSNS